RDCQSFGPLIPRERNHRKRRRRPRDHLNGCRLWPKLSHQNHRKFCVLRLLAERCCQWTFRRAVRLQNDRSEERRVGKECRSAWSRKRQKNKRIRAYTT